MKVEISKDEKSHGNQQISSTEYKKLEDEEITSTERNVLEILSTKEIISKISFYAFPISFYIVSFFLQETIILAFIGSRFNDKEMIEGIGLATLYNNCFLVGVAYGFVTGFDTLGTYAFGLKKLKLVGYLYHRCLITAYIMCGFFLLFSYFFAVKLLSLFNFRVEVLSTCSDFLNISMYFVVFDILSYMNFRYMNIIEKPDISMYILFITLLIHPFICYFNIYVLDFGLKGGAISLLITRSLISLLSSLYIIVFNPLPGSIFFFKRKSFRNFIEVLKVCLPAFFLYCAELWAFELLALVAIISSEFDYTVYILVNNIMLVCYSLSMGFGNAVTILIGDYISQGNIAMVKKVRNVSLVYCIILMTLIGVILVFLRKNIILVFMDDEEVVRVGMQCLILVAIGQVPDILQCMMQGLLRGLGMYYITSVICFTNYYVIMLGSSFLFGLYFNYRVEGIWIAYIIGTSITFFFYLCVESKTDYDLQVKEAIETVEKNQNETKKREGDGDNHDNNSYSSEDEEAFTLVN